MNPLMLFLMRLLQAAQQRQGNQNPAAQGGRGQYPQYQQGYSRTGQPLNGMGRFGPLANTEGTPQAQAIRQYLLQNFFGTPGAGINSPAPPGMPANQIQVQTNPGVPLQGAQGMQGGSPRDLSRDQQDWMNAMFSGEGRSPGGGGGGSFPWLV